MHSPIISTLRRSTALFSSTSTHCTTIPKRTWTSLTRGDEGLTVQALNNTKFSYVWLRDACPSPSSVHPSTLQKLHRTSDIPLDIAPLASVDGVQVTKGAIEVKWNDGHQSTYSKEFLARYADPAQFEEFHHDGSLRERAWTRSDIAKVPDLFIPYKEIQTPTGLVKAITQLTQYGLLFVSGVPNEKTGNDQCELGVLAETFGEIRETFYGRLWDVVNLRDSKNIAYTNLDLGLHMDLLYFQHPPRYQILHCLRNQVIGGTSIFVDALHAARTLRSTRPDDFSVLTSTPVEFHYINDGHHLHRAHQTIELSPSGEPSHINYSPPFQAPLPLNTPPTFYGALKRFATLLNNPKNTYEYTLREGDAVMFDNRRVLHGRTAFSDKENEEGMVDGKPNRWLKGCYLEADALVDRMRVLTTQLRKEVNEV